MAFPIHLKEANWTSENNGGLFISVTNTTATGLPIAFVGPGVIVRVEFFRMGNVGPFAYIVADRHETILAINVSEDGFTSISHGV